MATKIETPPKTPKPHQKDKNINNIIIFNFKAVIIIILNNIFQIYTHLVSTLRYSNLDLAVRSVKTLYK